MKRPVWISAVAAMALAACHRPAPVAAHPAAAVKIAAAHAAAAPTPAMTTPAPKSEPRPAGRAIAAIHPRATPARHAGRSRPVGLRRVSASVAARGAIDRDNAALDRGGRLMPTIGAAPQYDHAACVEKAHGYTVARAECYNAALASQEARMDRALRTAMAARSGERQANLVRAQQAWAAVRDSDCQDPNGATGELLYEGACRLRMTTERAAALEQLAG